MNIEQLLNTKAGKQLANDYQAEQDQERTDLFTELDTIKDQRNTEMQTLNLALDKTQTNFDTAQSRLKEAEKHKYAASNKVNHMKADYKNQVDRIIRQLKTSAPPEIDTFCAELREEIRELQSGGITRSGKKSNARTINLRLEGLREVISEAQALKLQAIPDIEDRLQALRAGLPAITMQ